MPSQAHLQWQIRLHEEYSSDRSDRRFEYTYREAAARRRGSAHGAARLTSAAAIVLSKAKREKGPARPQGMTGLLPALFSKYAVIYALTAGSAGIWPSFEAAHRDCGHDRSFFTAVWRAQYVRNRYRRSTSDRGNARAQQADRRA